MSEEGGYARVGARLVERGYAALPIMPGTKRPGYLRGGEWTGMPEWYKTFKDRLPSVFELQVWGRSDAGVCVVCGPASHGLVAVDIDTDDPQIVAAITGVLPPTTVRKTGAKGETLFFRSPALRESASFNLVRDGKKTRVCDLIGPGRQTVLPPTIHPETRQPYRWTGPDALEDVPPGDLPELDPDIAKRIAAALAPFGAEDLRAFSGRSAPAVGDDESPHRTLNNLALANLGAWVPQLGLYRCRRTHRGYEAVAIWRASNTGRQIEKRKLNLKIDPDGIRDFGADRGYTPLDLVMASGGCDLDTAFGFLARALGMIADEPITVALPAVVISEPEKRDTGPLPEPFEPLTRTAGVVGELVDWITATSRRPNRVLALGAAIGVVGTLIGRRVAGPTRSATHLYMLALAPTGSGKDHAKGCAARLLAAAGAKHHFGPSGFASTTSVINLLLRSPLSLCVQDEYGAFLKRINSKKASSHEAGISAILREAWGSSFQMMATPEWAGRRSETICAPALSIYGISVAEEFYGALTSMDVTGGFLNRFLVLTTHQYMSDTTPQMEPSKIPEAIKAALGELYCWSGSAMGTARLNDPSLDPEPDILPWASDAAKACYHDFSGQLEEKMRRDIAARPFFARTAEIAIRLATIRAAGRWGRGAAVDVSDMEWGRDIADISAVMTAEEARQHMAENERQMWSNRVARLIRERGAVTSRDIQQSLRGALRSADIKDILTTLVEAGEIEKTSSGFRAGVRQG